MTENPNITVIVNGELVTVATGTTISELLFQLNIRSRAIAVERNQEIQPSDRFQQQVLQPNDVLEIVTLVGGG